MAYELNTPDLQNQNSNHYQQKEVVQLINIFAWLLEENFYKSHKELSLHISFFLMVQ